MPMEPDASFVSELQDFVDKEIRPSAREIDEKGVLPQKTIAIMAERGYLGATFPKELGGLALDPLHYGILVSEIGKGCGNTRNLLTVHVSIVGECLLRWGTPRQIERWVPLMRSGAKIGAFSITEPEVGSDANNITTRFEKQGDSYVLHGKKKWTTLGDRADFFLIAAKNDTQMGVFIAERGMPGLSTAAIPGMLAARASHLAEIDLNHVRVPAENLLGPIDTGSSRVVATAFDHARYNIAWGGVGLIQAALDAMISYSRERRQFGKKIRTFQLIQEHIGHTAANVHAARALCTRAAQLRMNGGDAGVVEATIAKYFVSKIALDAASRAVQVHGGNGCTSLYPAERLYREAKVLEIVEGASEVLVQIIAGMALMGRA